MRDEPKDLATYSGSGERAARDALAELVALKDLKDRVDGLIDEADATNGPQIRERNSLVNEYVRRKPPAWAAARAALATPSQAPECAPTLTECPRCKNDITKCDGLFATPSQAVASALQAWQPANTRPYQGTYLVKNASGQVAPWINGLIHNNVGTDNDWLYGEAITGWMPLPLADAAPAHPVVQPGPGGSAPAPVPAGDALIARITEYMCNGGFFNPELMNHDAVRDLLIDCRAALSKQVPAGDAVALAAECEAMRAEMLELADKIEGNHVISGSPGPLFNMGWSAANESAARRIRAALPREGQADQGSETR